MAPIRILVVDDSLVVRKMLSDILSKDSDLTVVGSASDGRIALAKVEQLNPDLVTLDIEMPVMNGLEMLRELRKSHRHLPVIMFSTLTERGAAITIEALSLGASDYVAKPSSTGSAETSIETIRGELIPKIKALCDVSGRKKSQSLPIAPSSTSLRTHAKKSIEIVAIGTSTGGPNALAEVLPKIPADFPVPIVVVQHMPAVFTRLLAQRLASRCAIAVAEGQSGIDLIPGHAWIAPGNFHMTVVRAGIHRRLKLNQDPPEHSCRPAVDVLFRSVTAAYGSGVLGVVMTGMGADGAIGACHIRQAGGEVLIQDQNTAVVWGMPGQIYADGNADAIYPLQQLAYDITRRVQAGVVLGQANVAAAANRFA
jgi:two-component system chemotaxis response regulator CheB